MNDQVSGDDIIVEFRKGNTKSLNAIFKLYYAALCYFANRIISNKEESEDIVADSFFKLWKLHSNFESMLGVKAFLYVTTRNACFNYLKSSDRVNRQQTDMALLLDPDVDRAFAEVTRAEVLREVYAAIETLPTQCKKIVRMSFIEGMKNQEIAEQLNISVHTVKNQKVRGIYLLKMKLLGSNMLMVFLMHAHLTGKN